MRLPPVEVLLEWPAPNYKDPVTRGSALVIVNSIFISLVIITVALRLYTRLVIKSCFGLDDIFILLALVFTIALTAVVLLANSSYGWDRHVYDIPLDKFVPTSKIALTAKVVFTAAGTFTRLSLLCFYYRLVSDTGKKWFRWLVHANVIYTIGIFISFTFLSIFLCHPVKTYWTIGAPSDSCVDEGVTMLVCGVITCVADFATTITPIPLVMGLHMPRRQRAALAILFGLGTIVTVAGIIRTWFIYKSLFDEYDETWFAYPLWIAATIEIDLGVICASAPVLRPLLMKIPSSFSGTFSRGSSTKKSAVHTPNKQATYSSRTVPNASAASSKRRGESITGAPELSKDEGKSYEMKQWADAEGTLVGDDVERHSRDAILNSEDNTPSTYGVARLWDKIRFKASTSHTKQDMRITRTSEVEWQVEPASGRSSRRVSRGPRHREERDAQPLPPFPKKP